MINKRIHKDCQRQENVEKQEHSNTSKITLDNIMKT